MSPNPPLAQVAPDPMAVVGLERAAAGPVVPRPLGRPDDPALITDAATLTHGELRRHIRDAARELAGPRRLALVPLARTVESVVAYLAAMHAGHVVMLVGSADDPTTGALRERFAPALTVDADGRWSEHSASAPELHPDLALLLGTSGSTGRPKLVRLSHRNLSSNATAIGEYLRITPEDRALATLPLHYCYGLSVLHSHLAVGAAVVLTETSVVDPCCWSLAERSGATSFAGVPHTFELLDRGDPMQVLPHTLRTVTQAGGAMGAEGVLRWAGLGRQLGFDFVVMYGQTEATARMAYLPPQLATSHPGAIGVPIPGGSFSLAAIDADVHGDGADDARSVGELVYHGDNVMLGYAEHQHDLAAGRSVTELRTGDLARVGDDGVWEIVGRIARFAKPYGMRIDLDHLATEISDEGAPSLCISLTGADRGDDDVRESIGVVSTGEEAEHEIARRVCEVTSLPASAVRVVRVAELPRRENSKLDITAARRLLCTAATERPPDPPEPGGSGDALAAVTRIYAMHFPEARIGPEDTFVDLGGDSLTYVEVSMELEGALGHLPHGWHLLTVEQLGTTARPPGRLARVEIGAVLRCAGILMVLGRHVDLLLVGGGAHVLMALSGHNFSRFPLTAALRDNDFGRLFSAVAKVAVPTALWLTGVILVTGGYSWHNVTFTNALFGPDRWGDTWRYWYLEALVQILLVMALLFAVPALRRSARRFGFAVPLVFTLATLTIRFGLIEYGHEYRQVNLATGVAWLFMAGWAAQRARTRAQSLLVSAIVLLAVPGWFGDPVRELIVAAALLAIIWLRDLPLPRFIAPVIATIGGASLWIYLTHWQVYPPLEGRLPPLLLVVLCVAVGVAVWRLWEWAGRLYGAAVQRRIRRDPTAPISSKRPERTAGR